MGKLNVDQEALLAAARKELAAMLRNLQLAHSSEIQRARRVLQLLDELDQNV